MPTAPVIPAFAWLLNDDQIAAVGTYDRNVWSMRLRGRLRRYQQNALLLEHSDQGYQLSG